MGNYNPNAPIILGQQWVPIREETTQFTPAANVVELGHGFTLDVARQVREARFYINDLQAASDRGQTYLAAVYPRGTEDQSGPIERLIVPCNSTISTGGTVYGAATELTALVTQSSSAGIAYDTTLANTGIVAGFAMGQYPVLNGKRILAVNVLVGAVASEDITGPTRENNHSRISISGNTTLNSSAAPFMILGGLQENGIVSYELGEINQFWTTGAPDSVAERMPWNYTQLQRLDGGAPRIYFKIVTGTNFSVPTTAFFTLYYLALEVLFCEEQRTLVGAVQLGLNTALDSTLGANIVTLRAPQNYAENQILPAGLWDVVLSSANIGDSYGTTASASSEFADLNALRQLYAIPPHPGVQVNIPFPMDETAVGSVFSAVVTNVLPQLSLHASGGTLTEPHVYGRQAIAQVYGVNTATQDVVDDVTGVATTYPQARYIARRFGDTVGPLVLYGNGALSGSVAAISAAELDALPEILDGWKEVTVRFDVPPSMGAVVGFPSWSWSASGETKGNRYEVLGASAPALSGVGGNLYNLASASQRLDAATYQPSGGAAARLTWMPQGVGSPYVSGASADSTSDAFLIFSQDPPTISGMALTSLTQTVSGNAFNCGSLPCCIPSGIPYQRVTWSPVTGMPASGFGAYELQRYDSQTAAFQTIMLSSSVAASGFNDYEARVGVTSVYRIRALNSYNFAGAWSGQVSGAPPAPGVTGGCPDMTGALIFTSNAAQSGVYNLAYTMQWDSSPVEGFDLPEAGMVSYQPMYQRDGAVAFHGTERGLETFSRVLLVRQGAAVPAVLANVTQLRDTAWANLPYVCVRDGRGNRWFASVRVPNVQAANDATNYTARVDIVELTRTAAALDVSS